VTDLRVVSPLEELLLGAGLGVWLAIVLAVVGLCRHAARGDRALRAPREDVHGAASREDARKPAALRPTLLQNGSPATVGILPRVTSVGDARRGQRHRQRRGRPRSGAR